MLFWLFCFEHCSENAQILNPTLHTPHSTLHNPQPTTHNPQPTTQILNTDFQDCCGECASLLLPEHSRITFGKQSLLCCTMRRQHGAQRVSQRSSCAYRTQDRAEIYGESPGLDCRFLLRDVCGQGHLCQADAVSLITGTQVHPLLVVIGLKWMR